MQKEQTIPFDPHGNYILLGAVEQSEKTKGGLYIPPQYRGNVNQGEVLKLGPHVPEGEVEIGEIVVFAMHTEHRLEIDGREFIIIQGHDIMLSDKKRTPKPEPHPEFPLPEPKQERRKPLGLEAVGLKN